MKKVTSEVIVIALLLSVGLVGCMGRTQYDIDIRETTENSENLNWYVDKIEAFKTVNSNDIMMLYADHGLNLNYPVSAQIASEIIEITYREDGEASQVCTVDTDKYKEMDIKFGAYNRYSSGNTEYNTNYHIKTYEYSREALERLLDYYINDAAINSVIDTCLRVYGNEDKEMYLLYLDGKICIKYESGLVIDIYKNLDILNEDEIDLDKLKEFEPLLDTEAIKNMENFSIKTPFNKINLIDLKNSEQILKSEDGSTNFRHKLKIERVWTVIGDEDSADRAIKTYSKEKQGDLKVEEVSIIQNINDTSIELRIGGCDRFNIKRAISVLVNLSTRDDTHLATVASKILNIEEDDIEEVIDIYMKNNGTEGRKGLSNNETMAVYSLGKNENIGISYTYSTRSSSK